MHMMSYIVNTLCQALILVCYAVCVHSAEAMWTSSSSSTNYLSTENFESDARHQQLSMTNTVVQLHCFGESKRLLRGTGFFVQVATQDSEGSA